LTRCLVARLTHSLLAILDSPLDCQAVGATPLGCEYLLTKAIIETASALSLASYLLLKRELPATDAGSLSCHPVLSRLQKLHKQAATLEDFTAERHPELNDQLDKLVEAAALMKDGVVPSEEGDSDAADDDKSENAGVRADESDHDKSEADDEENESAGSDMEPADNADKKTASASSSSDDDSDSEDEDARRRSVLNEARFALRPAELMQEAIPTANRKRRPAPDFGEDEEQEAASGTKSKAFAATLNSIQQRSRAVPKKSKMAEDLDEFLGRDDDIMADEAEEEADFNGRDRKSRSDPEMVDDDEGGDFYSAVAQKSKSRKDVRRAMHQVAPKFPRVEREIDGERTVSKQILKNRGLVPHKNRLNRNPRVKKREQYRKAQIRRRGAVREIRTDEGHKYGGEGTGIKTGLSRSRQLA
jgi:U3 small nucleolar RNA-associated protein 3